MTRCLSELNLAGMFERHVGLASVSYLENMMQDLFNNQGMPARVRQKQIPGRQEFGNLAGCSDFPQPDVHSLQNGAHHWHRKEAFKIFDEIPMIGEKLVMHVVTGRTIERRDGEVDQEDIDWPPGIPMHPAPGIWPVPVS